VILICKLYLFSTFKVGRWSAKIAVVEWLRTQPVGVEIAGLNFSQHFSSDIFVHLFNPWVNVLLEYLDPAIYTMLVS